MAIRRSLEEGPTTQSSCDDGPEAFHPSASVTASFSPEGDSFDDLFEESGGADALIFNFRMKSPSLTGTKCFHCHVFRFRMSQSQPQLVFENVL